MRPNTPEEDRQMKLVEDATDPANQPDDEPTTGRRLDKKLRAMGAILRLIEEMDEPGRGRIVAWIHARYHAAQP